MYFVESARIGLRRFDLPDAEFVLTLWNDPDYVANVADRGLRSRADAEQYLKETVFPNCTQEGYGPYLVELKATRQQMGFVGLFRRKDFTDPDIGYAFLPAFRGQGYAYESARLLETVAREVLRLKALNGFTATNNPGSKSILLKLGLTYRRTFLMAGYEGETDHYAKEF